MQIKNNTSITIYVEGTESMRRGPFFNPIEPGKSKNVIDAFIQRIYSDKGSSLVINDKDGTIRNFGELEVKRAPEKEFGKNAVIIELKEEEKPKKTKTPKTIKD